MQWMELIGTQATLLVMIKYVDYEQFRFYEVVRSESKRLNFGSACAAKACKMLILCRSWKTDSSIYYYLYIPYIYTFILILLKCTISERMIDANIISLYNVFVLVSICFTKGKDLVDHDLSLTT